MNNNTQVYAQKVELLLMGASRPPPPSVFSGIRLFILIYQKIAVLC